MRRHNVCSLDLKMRVSGQIKQTIACNVAMAGSICIINNSYHETFLMKFSPVLSAVRGGNKGANIEKAGVCCACKCNAWQGMGALMECRACIALVQLQRISHANVAPKMFRGRAELLKMFLQSRAVGAAGLWAVISMDPRPLVVSC